MLLLRGNCENYMGIYCFYYFRYCFGVLICHLTIRGLIVQNITRHQGKLEILKRLPSSLNGNPRYLLNVDGFTCKTAVDSSFGYCVTNFDNKQVIATIGSHYGTATLNSLKGV